MSDGPVLFVGGTGMLAPAVRAIAADRQVFVVARRPSPGDAIVPVRGDWAEPEVLAANVRRARGDGPLFAAMILWTHTPYRAAVDAALSPQLRPDAVVVTLYGSASASPAAAPLTVPPWHAPPRRFRRLILGFADEPGGRTRWLTDAEISGAALAALDDSAVEQVAGRIRPWSDRP